MAWFKDSVDSILGEFHTIIDRLHKHADDKTAEAAKHLDKAVFHPSQQTKAESEAARARHAAGKISDLVK